eukprot:1891392-Prymnesium_polylepis.1
MGLFKKAASFGTKKTRSTAQTTPTSNATCIQSLDLPPSAAAPAAAPFNPAAARLKSPPSV